MLKLDRDDIKALRPTRNRRKILSREEIAAKEYKRYVRQYKDELNRIKRLKLPISKEMIKCELAHADEEYQTRCKDRSLLRKRIIREVLK